MVPDGMSWQSNAIWVMGFFALATLGFTAVTIPYGAMAGEMTQDPQERSVMMAWRMGFASLGLLTAGAVVPALAGDTKAGYGMAVLMVSPVMILAIWMSILATRKAPRIATPTGLGLGQMLRLVLSNRRFTLLVVIYGVLTLGVALIAAGLQLSALYLIVKTGGPLAGLAAALGVFAGLFAMFIVGSVLSQAVWVMMAKRLGKLQALVVGIIAYTVVLWLIYSQLPSTSFTIMAALFVIAGFCNGAYQQLPWAMYPDLMDVTRDESGEAVEGAFAALWLFGQKVANAVAPLVLGLVLSAYGFLESTDGVADQSAQALEALRWAVTLLPAAIMWLGIVMLVLIYRPRARGVHDARAA
jgi:GPH family glycoside/pentoside/hexuronide:cation symporter